MDVARLPSRFSLAILLLGIVLVAVALSCSPNPSTDLYWQLRTGQSILLTKSAPHFDTYSWTRHGSPWVAHEWLSFVVFWLAYKFGHGFAGLLIFKTVVLALTVALFFLYIARTSGYRLLPAYLFTLCAAYPLSVGFQARPQIFTYLFVTITCCAVLKFRQTGNEKNNLWFLVPLYLLWTNLHAGVYLGIFLLLIWALGDLMDGYFGRPSDTTFEAKKCGLHLLRISVACLMCTLINPYGIMEFVNLLQTVRNQNMLNTVEEWRSPSLHSAAGINFSAIATLCVLGMIYARKKVRIADFLVVAAMLHYGLYSLRNIPVFALAGVMTAAPYFFSCLSGMLPTDNDGNTIALMPGSVLGSRPRIGIVIIGATGFLIISILATSVNLMLNVDWAGSLHRPILTRLSSANVEISANPVPAVSQINAGLVPQDWKLYNSYGSGSYLIWALPRHAVWIDGRADVYFGSVFDDYVLLDEWPYNWEQILAKRMPDFVIMAPNDAQTRMFMSSPDWALIYVDYSDLDYPIWAMGGYNSMIFVRRSLLSQQALNAMREKCPVVTSTSFKATYHWYPAVH